MIKAVFFDLDGVLVDMCELHKKALNKALLEIEGFEITEEEHNLVYNGLPTLKKLSILLANGRVNENNIKKINQLKQHYTEYFIKDCIRPDPDKISMLKTLVQNDILVAVVTNSTRATALLMLKNAGLWDFVNYLIANDDTSSPKPSPDPYIFAWNKSRLDKNEIIVLEDNVYGVTSASNAGLKVFTVKDINEVNIDLVAKCMNLAESVDEYTNSSGGYGKTL